MSVTPVQGEVSDNSLDNTQAPPAGAEVTPPVEAPLDEGAGLNSSVDELSDIALEACINRVKADAPRLLQRMKDGETAMLRFGDKQLQKTVLGNIVFQIKFVPHKGVDMLRILKGELTPPEHNRIEVELVIGYGQVFVHAPQIYQIKSINRLLGTDDFKTTIVHELTHAVQVIGRSQNNYGYAGASLELAAQMKSDKMPELNGIGTRIYLADEYEIGARVAEVAKLMRDADPNTPTEALIQQIQHSRIWQEMKYLMHFPASDVYTKIIRIAQERYADKLPSQDTATVEDYVANNILVALQHMAEERPSRLSNQIRKALSYKSHGQTRTKDLSYALHELETIFKRRGEELKRSIFKTISLARKTEVEAKPAPQSEKALDEENLSEAYPEAFDMGEFRELRNFTQRIAYCNERLKKLGSGSSRIAYEVDGDKVLKLAKNAKGIAQNEVEAQGYLQNMHGKIITKRFDAHPDDLWIEMERATKVTPAKFKAMAGVTLNELRDYVMTQTQDISPRYLRLDPKVSAFCADSDFIMDVTNLALQNDLHPGDLSKPSTWGLVKRDGREMLVMVDFGFTNAVADEHYSSHSKRHRAYEGY